MRVIVLPGILRDKLGSDGAKAFVDMINATGMGARENTMDVIVERFERRLSEVKTDLVRWMFLFWTGQVVVTVALIGFPLHVFR